jgi:predicted porin
MTDSKKGTNKKSAPYEPPRLFDLSGGVAYAASECDNGNSVSTGGVSPVGDCDNGNQAIGGECDNGNRASGCDQGNRASS